MPARAWRGLEARIGEASPAPGPLEVDHELVRALLEPDQRSGGTVQYVTVQELGAAGFRPLRLD